MEAMACTMLAAHPAATYHWLPEGRNQGLPSEGAPPTAGVPRLRSRQGLAEMGDPDASACAPPQWLPIDTTLSGDTTCSSRGQQRRPAIACRERQSNCAVVAVHAHAGKPLNALQAPPACSTSTCAHGASSQVAHHPPATGRRGDNHAGAHLPCGPGPPRLSWCHLPHHARCAAAACCRGSGARATRPAQRRQPTCWWVSPALPGLCLAGLQHLMPCCCLLRHCPALWAWSAARRAGCPCPWGWQTAERRPCGAGVSCRLQLRGGGTKACWLKQERHPE